MGLVKSKYYLSHLISYWDNSFGKPYEDYKYFDLENGLIIHRIRENYFVERGNSLMGPINRDSLIKMSEESNFEALIVQLNEKETTSNLLSLTTDKSPSYNGHNKLFINNSCDKSKYKLHAKLKPKLILDRKSFKHSGSVKSWITKEHDPLFPEELDVESIMVDITNGDNVQCWENIEAKYTILKRQMDELDKIRRTLKPQKKLVKSKNYAKKENIKCLRSVIHREINPSAFDKMSYIDKNPFRGKTILRTQSRSRNLSSKTNSNVLSVRSLNSKKKSSLKSKRSTRQSITSNSISANSQVCRSSSISLSNVTTKEMRLSNKSGLKSASCLTNSTRKSWSNPRLIKSLNNNINNPLSTIPKQLQQMGFVQAKNERFRYIALAQYSSVDWPRLQLLIKRLNSSYLAKFNCLVNLSDNQIRYRGNLHFIVKVEGPDKFSVLKCRNCLPLQLKHSLILSQENSFEANGLLKNKWNKLAFKNESVTSRLKLKHVS